AIARIAMHVLVEVERSGAPAIEERDVSFLRVEQVGRGQLVDQAVESDPVAAADAPLGGDRRANFGQRLDELRGRVGEQRGERLQGLHATRSFGLIAITFFALPKRLVAVEPSEQPLPKEK